MDIDINHDHDEMSIEMRFKERRPVKTSSSRSVSSSTLRQLTSLFEVYDTDGDGQLCVDELRNAISLVIEKMTVFKQLGRRQLETMTTCLLHEMVRTRKQNKDLDAHPDSDVKSMLSSKLIEKQRISKESFIAYIDATAGEQLAAFMQDSSNEFDSSFNHSAIPIERRPSKKEIFDDIAKQDRWGLKSVREESREMKILRILRTKWRAIMSWIMLAIILTGLFIEASYRFKLRNNWFRLAKGFGQMINFIAVALIMFMSRNLLQWIRNSRFGSHFAVDHHVKCHKVLGIAAVLASTLHSAFHFVNLSTTTYGAGQGYIAHAFEYMFTNRLHRGWMGLQGISGMVLLLLLAAIACASIPCVRARGHFEIFYWTHALVWPWIAVLFIHAPSFWKWMIGPGALYLADRLYRLLVARNELQVHDATILPGRIVVLKLLRPAHLTYLPGQYFFVQVPLVSRHEWHPLSASSAPNDPSLTFHIRARGNWSNRLYQLVEHKMEICQQDVQENHQDLENSATSSESDGLRMDDCIEDARNPLLIAEVFQYPRALGNVLLDGPYGSPHASILEHKRAVLIAAGVGMTPFVSVLSWVLRQSTVSTTSNVNPMHNLRYLHFIWLVRDENEFRWCYRLLRDIEAMQMNGKPSCRIEADVFLTAVACSSMETALFNVASEAYGRSHNGCDPISGLCCTRIRVGSPSWKHMLRGVLRHTLASQAVDFSRLDPNPLRVQSVPVYYSGPQGVASIVNKFCDVLHMPFVQEIF